MGLDESSPSLVVPRKNSTLDTVPSLSLALALIVIFAGAVKVAPFAGLDMLTVGAPFGASTVIATTLEVVLSPSSSVALAVRL